jgi:hypothetical protein
MNASSETRAQAARVAKWLVEKDRPDEAVMLLSAWAASGPNDSEGQQLLAEALRIDPSAHIAQLAFEHMEGVEGDHGELFAAAERYGKDVLDRLEAEMRRPSFRRAQMGFNNNILFQDQVFHVKTEDSGLDQPHIMTHLFADGGRVIKSHKRTYDGHVNRPDVAEYVRGLMKAQHLEMVMMLRDGKFDAILAGQAVGGSEVLTEPPNVPIKAKQKPSRPKLAVAAPPAAAPAVVPRQARGRFRLHVLRSLWGGPERYDPPGDTAILGTLGDVALAGDVYCHPREAALHWEKDRLWVEDLEGGNGIFMRIRTPVELEFGDEFVVGDQLLSVLKNPVADDGPSTDPTYFYSSPKWPSSFRIVQIFEGGAAGACVVARGNTLQIGSAIGDLLFPDDPLVAEQHCLVEEQAGTVVLTDLGARTGVFVRLRGQQELGHGDELMVGRTRLVVDLSRSRGS